MTRRLVGGPGSKPRCFVHRPGVPQIPSYLTVSALSARLRKPFAKSSNKVDGSSSNCLVAVRRLVCPSGLRIGVLQSSATQKPLDGRHRAAPSFSSPAVVVQIDGRTQNSDLLHPGGRSRCCLGKSAGICNASSSPLIDI